MNIDRCKENIILKMFDLYDKDHVRVLKDFTYFSFLGGNDFVCALPSVQIKDGGFEKLLRAYKHAINCTNSYLLTDNVVNINVLRHMLEFLVQNETKFIKRRYHNLCNIKASKLDEQTIGRYMELYEHSSYYDPMNPFYEYYKHTLHAIDYNEPNWNQQYNDYFFSESVSTVCKDYLMSIQFCHLYYLNNDPPSWFFHYKHRVAPSIIDLLQHIESLDDIYTFTYKPPEGFLDTPITPFEQMLAILPPQSINLLPQPFQCFVTMPDAPIAHNYPRKVKLDVLAGLKNIYSEPILPELNFNEYRLVCKNVILYETEIKRNELREKPFRKIFGQMA